MKARLSFIALHAFTRKTQVAAGASRVRRAEVASRGLRGLCVLRRLAHGRSQYARELGAPVQTPTRSRSRNRTTSRLHHRKAERASPFSRYQSMGSVRASVRQLSPP